FNAASDFTGNYYYMMCLGFLAGLFHGVFFGIGAVVASELARPGKESQAIATMFTGLTLANVVGVPGGTYLGHIYGWNIAFLIVGIIGFITLTSIYYWMPALPPSSTEGLRKDLKVFKRPQLWLVFILTTIGTGGFFAWYSYIA